MFVHGVLFVSVFFDDVALRFSAVALASSSCVQGRLHFSHLGSKRRP